VVTVHIPTILIPIEVAVPVVLTDEVSHVFDSFRIIISWYKIYITTIRDNLACIQKKTGHVRPYTLSSFSSYPYTPVSYVMKYILLDSLKFGELYSKIRFLIAIFVTKALRVIRLSHTDQKIRHFRHFMPGMARISIYM
jgi:hypothetical protein